MNAHSFYSKYTEGVNFVNLELNVLVRAECDNQGRNLVVNWMFALALLFPIKANASFQQLLFLKFINEYLWANKLREKEVARFRQLQQHPSSRK